MLTTATASLRHKERYGDDLELAPVRLFGGFVNVDTHLGCVGCSFCLNRRYPVHRRILEEGVHREYSEIGLTTDRLVSILRALPSIRDARVPVRIGHITDLAFEETAAREIVEGLDPRSPVLLATRFPIGEETRALLQKHRNAMVHLTLTPAISGCEETSDTRRAIESLRGLPIDQVFVVLCPLVAGAGPAVRELLRALPIGSRVGLKEIDVTAIPGCGGLTPMPRAEIDELALEAEKIGHKWMPFYGCLVRANLGLPCFFHARAAERAPRVCANCSNQATCSSVRRPSVEEVEAAARAIGFEPMGVRILDDRIDVEIAEPAARSDEVFLSEKLTAEVRLSTIARAEKRETIEIDEAVLQRWEGVGFYPVETMKRAARSMAALTWQRT